MSIEKRKRGLYYYQDDFGQWQKVHKVKDKYWRCSVDKSKVFETAKDCFEYLDVPH